MVDLTRMPKAILIALDKMRNSFGGVEVTIVSDCYRLEPSEDAPAGALGCDIEIKIPNSEMVPLKLFFRNSLAEDICWTPYGQLMADEFVFDAIRPQLTNLNKVL